MGLGVGHVSPFLADDRLGQHGVAQQFVIIRHVNFGRGISFRVALHDGNAQQGHAGAAGFRLNDWGVHRFQPYCVRGKGIIASRYGNGRRALVIDLGCVYHHSRPAGSHAHSLARDPSAPVRLQVNIGGNLFRFLLPFAVGNLPGLIRCRRQRAAAFHGHKVVGDIGIVSHADRNRHTGGRHACHIRFALGSISRFHGQVAVNSGQDAVIDSDAGVTLCGQARIAYADTGDAQPCLHGTDADGVFLIICNIALMSRQGHAAAFDSGILYRNIVQLVQVVNGIRHVYRCNAQGTAASVQVCVVQFGILY